MSFTFDDLDIRTSLPEIPGRLPVAALAAPCLTDRKRAIDQLTKELDIDGRTTIEVPFGYAVGGKAGQVEVFAASGAIRARNTRQLARYSDEQRPWTDVEKEKSDDGVVYRLGEAAVQRLTRSARRTLDAIGLADDQARISVTVEQWTRLHEDGTVLDSGPGRATVQLAYQVEGLPLIGAGAKTNLHYDPDDGGDTGILARFFHVRREIDGVREVASLPLEEAFRPVLTANWSGFTVDPRTARMALTAVTFGLLTQPADVSQRYAAPALMVEGRVEGALDESGREMELRFGRYLPLISERALAEAGYASTGPLIPGMEVAGRARGV